MTSSFEIRDCQQQINKLHARVFGPNGPAPTESAQPGESPLNDDEVLRLIHSSKQAKRFNALWEGSIEGYPSHSKADLGLCNILAFWCGRDPEQMDRLFRESNLWRKKWDERHGKDTYGNITIQEAIRKTTEVFTPRSDPTGDFDDPDSGQGGRRKKPTQAKILVELANEAELFHNADGVCYATVPMNGHLENWPIRSKPFRRWLSQKFYSTTGTPPGSQALSDAMNVIEGKAQFDGPEEETFIRLAKKKDSIYLDLADPQWRCVEISKDDWGVLDKPPVKFIRPKGLLPIPAPEKGGSLEDLRPFINCRDESDFRLLVSWLIQALNPDGPYPILILEGEQGSAKSTTSKALRSTIDPNLAPIRAVPRDERDLIIAATNGLVAAFDNLSGVPNWLSDALCRIATGGGIGTRELYTNGDEFIFEATRPQILNGIDQIASRHDLADRSIILSLPAIPEDQRVQERLFWAAFDQAHPRILGALLTAVSTALRNIDQTKLDRLPRMADFALWVAAAEPSLPWDQGGFMDAYEGNRADVVECSLDADPVACAVRSLMANASRWTGTATDLMGILKGHVPDDATREKRWPKLPHILSMRLRRSSTFLRKVGIDVRFEPREGGTGIRLIEIVNKKG